MSWDSEPGVREWMDHVKREVAPLIEGSYASCSLVPSDGEPDVKFAVELGLSIMYDKPIVLVVPPGTRLPDHLVRVADGIVEGDPSASDTAARIAEAVNDL